VFVTDVAPPERSGPVVPPPKPGDRVAAPSGPPLSSASPNLEWVSRRWRQPVGPVAAVPPTNGAAIAAIVLAFLVPPAGLALGIVGVTQTAYSGEAGRGLAIGAIWVSSLLILVWLIALAAVA
jgi:hypothetical protein